MLKGPQRCVTCPQKRTNYSDYEMGFYYPDDRGDIHECHLTEYDITKVVDEGLTFHKRCPLWINTEWPIHPQSPN